MGHFNIWTERTKLSLDDLKRVPGSFPGFFFFNFYLDKNMADRLTNICYFHCKHSRSNHLEPLLLPLG